MGYEENSPFDDIMGDDIIGVILYLVLIFVDFLVYGVYKQLVLYNSTTSRGQDQSMNFECQLLANIDQLTTVYLSGRHSCQKPILLESNHFFFCELFENHT